MGSGCGCASAPSEETIELMNWDDHFPPMTRMQLKRKREIFWDTRNSGVREVWMGLRSAAELKRDGDEESAAAIITAMGCTPLKPGKSKKSLRCYDERGAQYSMPCYLFEDPSNMIENRGAVARQTEEKKEDDAAALLVSNESVSFKVRLNIGRDVEVTMKQQDTIGQLKNYLSEQLHGLDPTKIRILARGKMYSNSYTLIDPFPIKNGDIIHASFPSTLYDQLCNNSNPDSKCRIRRIP